MLRILLISLLIIGCFSNFARNTWGFELRCIAELLLGFTFLNEFIFSIIKKDSTLSKTDRIFSQIERICIAFFFIGFVFKTMHWAGGGLFYVFSMGFIMLTLTFRLIKHYTQLGKNRKLIFWMLNLVYWSICTFLFFGLLKEDIGDDGIEVMIIAIIFGYITSVTSLLLLLNCIEVIVLRNKSALQNFSTHLFLFSTLFLTAGVQFKVMHWPLSNVLLLLGFLGFLITLGFSLTTKITENGTTKKMFTHFLTKFPIVRFSFLYFGIWSIYILLAIYNVAPRFYSHEYPYAYEEFLEESNHERANKLEANYDALMDEIYGKSNPDHH